MCKLLLFGKFGQFSSLLLSHLSFSLSSLFGIPFIAILDYLLFFYVCESLFTFPQFLFFSVTKSGHCLYLSSSTLTFVSLVFTLSPYNYIFTSFTNFIFQFQNSSPIFFFTIRISLLIFIIFSINCSSLS